MKAIGKIKLIRNLLIICIAGFFITACEKVNPRNFLGKDGQGHGHLKLTNDYPADVAIAWMKLHLELNRTSPVPLRLNGYRFLPYCAIALYESVVPGMPSYRSLSGQLTELPPMPHIIQGISYHWPTTANAALAGINRLLFAATASDANKTSIDSLENAINDYYAAQVSQDEFQRSAEFGKAVAQIIFDWSTTDGSENMIDPNFMPPTGPGLWIPTPPAFAPPVGPHWGGNRLFVAGSLTGSEPPPPPAYSVDPGSEFYKMEKEVYDISQTLTAEQTAIGLFWRDAPGYGNAHFSSVLTQVLEQVNPSLDIAALALAKAGIAIGDATIGCWKIKFNYNSERPVTYIRGVLGYADWNPLFATPPHPDFPSAHSTVSGAMSETLTGLFGDHFKYTDHSYDYLGMASRTYNSFNDLNTEMINARVYAGIHTRNADIRGVAEGKKIAENIDHLIRFRK